LFHSALQRAAKVSALPPMSSGAWLGCSPTMPTGASVVSLMLLVSRM